MYNQYKKVLKLETIIQLDFIMFVAKRDIVNKEIKNDKKVLPLLRRQNKRNENVKINRKIEIDTKKLRTIPSSS